MVLARYFKTSRLSFVCCLIYRSSFQVLSFYLCVSPFLCVRSPLHQMHSVLTVALCAFLVRSVGRFAVQPPVRRKVEARVRRELLR